MRAVLTGVRTALITAERRKAAWEKLEARKANVVFKVAPGVKMTLYWDSHLSRIIYLRKFELDETDFTLRFLRPGDVFVDVGANVGFFSMLAAKTVGPVGQVVSFEPSLRTSKRLAANASLNGFNNLVIEQCAVSAETGHLGMAIAEDGMDVFNSFGRPTDGENFTTEMIPTVKWDEYAERRLLAGQVAFMKIDVEGWEGKVLEGGRKMLSRPDAPVLQVEFTGLAALGAGTTCQSNYRLIESFGYKLYTYSRITRQLTPEPIREDYGYINLYAVKNLAVAQARLNGK
jgi:FkbM family methyltransferase